MVASLISCPQTSRQTFPALCRPTVFHGVFTRKGGVSPAPWNSLNVGFGLGDEHQNVITNRNTIKQTLGAAILVSAKQVHGAKVCTVTKRPTADLEIDGCDALITNVAGIGLMIQHADCQAILLHDPVRRTVGIIHAGWRGSVAGIIKTTVEKMIHAFATNPADLKAAISPSLGPCCAEFIHYRSELPSSFHAYQVRPRYFDFWAISHDQLRQTGVPDANIVSANLCTVCNPDYFSYRRDKNTGRCASVIGLCE